MADEMSELGPNRLRERLLAQSEPPPDALRKYRQEMETVLTKQENSLKWQKWVAASFWIYTVLLGTSFLILAGNRPDVSPILLAVAGAFFLLIAAAVELLKYFINRSQSELLRAIKGLEVEVLELKEQMLK